MNEKDGSSADKRSTLIKTGISRPEPKKPVDPNQGIATTTQPAKPPEKKK